MNETPDSFIIWLHTLRIKNSFHHGKVYGGSSAITCSFPITDVISVVNCEMKLSCLNLSESELNVSGPFYSKLPTLQKITGYLTEVPSPKFPSFFKILFSLHHNLHESY